MTFLSFHDSPPTGCCHVQHLPTGNKKTPLTALYFDLPTLVSVKHMSNGMGEFWLDDNLQTSLTTDQCENKKEKSNNNRLGIAVVISIL